MTTNICKAPRQRSDTKTTDYIESCNLNDDDDDDYAYDNDGVDDDDDDVYIDVDGCE